MARKAVDNNHGLCPKHPTSVIPSTPGPHLFQSATNLPPTWCLLCNRAPAVFCDVHPGRHGWAKDCVNAHDADAAAPDPAPTPTDGERR